MKPDLFIVGAPKCGTTALHRYLEKHPHVLMSRQKELGYWQYVTGERWRHHQADRQARSMKAYLGHFPPKTDAMRVGESTPAYMHNPDIPPLLSRFQPDAFIIMGLRDPIDRAFSAWRMAVRNGVEKRSFDECVFLDDLHTLDYTARSIYAPAIKRWQELFRRVFIYRQEDLKADTDAMLARVCRFLQVDPHQVASIPTDHEHNKGLDYRHPLTRRLSQHPWSIALARLLLPHSARAFINERILAKPGALPRPSPEARRHLEHFFRDDQKELERMGL